MWPKGPCGDQRGIFLQVLESLDLMPSCCCGHPTLLVTTKICLHIYSYTAFKYQAPFSCGVGNGNPLQYSWLRNPTDRRAWQATVHVVTKESDVTERLNNNKSFTWCLWKIFFLKICHTNACLLPGLLTNENGGAVCHKADCTNQGFYVFILLVFNQCALSFVRKDKNYFLLIIQAENVFPLQSVLKLPVSHH